MIRFEPAIPTQRVVSTMPVTVRVVRVERDNAVFEIAGRQVRATSDSHVTVGERFSAFVSARNGALTVRRAFVPNGGGYAAAPFGRVGVVADLSRDLGLEFPDTMARALMLLARATPGSPSSTGPVAALVSLIASLVADPEKTQDIRRALRRFVAHAVDDGGHSGASTVPRLLTLVSRFLDSLPTDASPETHAELERSIRDLPDPIRHAARFHVDEEDAEVRVVVPFVRDNQSAGSVCVGLRFEGRPGQRLTRRPLSFDVSVRADGQATVRAYGEANGDSLTARFFTADQVVRAEAHSGLEPLAARLRQLGFREVTLTVEPVTRHATVAPPEPSVNVVA